MHETHAAAFHAVRLAAIVLIALCLVPAGAHLFEMPHKISMPAGEYMIVQKIYAGWALFGVAILAAILAAIAHTWMVRGTRRAFPASLAALVCLLVTQAIFWTYTYPMNVASRNWTVVPEGFEAARTQWEYSHAVSAVLTFTALVLITWSALRQSSA